MKKRLFAGLFATLILLALLVFPICADEITTEEALTEETPITTEEPTETEEPETEAVTETETAEEETNETFFSRIYEYFTNNSTQVLTIAGDAVIAGAALLLKKKNDTKLSDIIGKVTQTATSTDKTASEQTAVTKTVNELIKAYNDLTEKYETYGATEVDRSKLMSATLLSNTAILDILYTVYSGNKNLPQGIKDIIALKYSNTLKAMQDDTQMKGVVELIRNSINEGVKETTETETTVAEEKTEETAEEKTEG